MHMTAELSTLLPARQQPSYPDAARVRQVAEQLSRRPGPVDPISTRALSRELMAVPEGRRFVVMAGECAETFEDAGVPSVLRKAAHVHRLADIVVRSGVSATRIGRFGGQFAKPRSTDHELLDGRQTPVYRGDAVNGFQRDHRQADPSRLLTAHDYSAAAVRALRSWDGQRSGRGPGLRAPRTFLGHEALLLDYEAALLRHGGSHASSGHYLWIGERTRQLDHAHIALAASIDNPVGVKLGPSAESAEVQELISRLGGENHAPGRLSLIIRMGADQLGHRLPALLEGLGRESGRVAWVLDPMHGNGRVNRHGQKTRLLSDVRKEIEDFFAVLLSHNLWPGGIHLESTPDDVTECVADSGDLATWLPRFQSTCDPRLNPVQAAEVAEQIALLLYSASRTRRTTHP